MVYDKGGISDSIKGHGHWPETDKTPTLTLFLDNLSDRSLRRVKQLGVTGVSIANLDTGGLETWTDEVLKRHIDRVAEADLELRNIMFDPGERIIFGKDGRDEDIETIINSLEVAGRQGLPVMEYNFYAHRIVEGYKVVPGRGGSGLMDFNNDRIKNLPPLQGKTAISIDDLWDNVTYYLKAVIPIAEMSDVRLALHPNDPPAPISRGSGQIMGSVEGWKRLADIVLGHDPVEICRYFGERDQINHVHFRNVITRTPQLDYTEVWVDEGQVDMFAVMSELVRQKYPRLIYPEHPPQNDSDTEFPFDGISATTYTGFAFTAGYARAMMKAALATQSAAK